MGLPRSAVVTPPLPRITAHLLALNTTYAMEGLRGAEGALNQFVKKISG
jgi:hypothetical protein